MSVVCKCGKRPFRDRIAALLFLASRRSSWRRREIRAYRCQFGRWHTTSQERAGGAS